MDIKIREFNSPDLDQMISIWNEVVKDGMAFPQEDFLDLEDGEKFFNSQTFTGVAENEDGNIVGLYILHPNNIGRVGHIGNASYAVRSDQRDKHIGKELVLDSLRQAKANEFKILQFNAVVKSDELARHPYGKVGFNQLGKIPNGFRLKDGTYDDIYLYYYNLDELN